MTYREFEVFIEVCKTKNMTQAANNLFMSQPAVSYIINKTEEKYKTKLFIRENDGLKITTEGNTLLNYALQLTYSHNQIKKILDNKIEKIKLGVVKSIADFYLPKYMRIFKKENIDIEIDVIVGDYDYILQALHNNEIEIALIDSEYFNKDFEIVPYHYDLYKAIVSINNNLSTVNSIKLEDLIKYDLLLRETGSIERTQLEKIFKLKSISKKPIYECYSNNAIISGVLENMGVSILPSSLINEKYYSEHIKLIKINDLNLYRKFFYVKNKRLRLDVRTQQLLKAIQNTHQGDNL